MIRAKSFSKSQTNEMVIIIIFFVKSRSNGHVWLECGKVLMREKRCFDY